MTAPAPANQPEAAVQPKPAPVKAGLISKFNAVADASYIASAILRWIPFIDVVGWAGVSVLPIASVGLGAVNTGIDAKKFIFDNRKKDEDSDNVKSLKTAFRRAAGFSVLQRGVSLTAYAGFAFLMMGAAVTVGAASGALVSSAVLVGALGALFGLGARESENDMAAADAAIKKAQAPAASQPV